MFQEAWKGRFPTGRDLERGILGKNRGLRSQKRHLVFATGSCLVLSCMFEGQVGRLEDECIAW